MTTHPGGYGKSLQLEAQDQRRPFATTRQVLLRGGGGGGADLPRRPAGTAMQPYARARELSRFLEMR